LRGTVVERRSVTGDLSYARLAADDGWPLVVKPSARRSAN